MEMMYHFALKPMLMESTYSLFHLPSLGDTFPDRATSSTERHSPILEYLQSYTPRRC
jgi:hypothetical protein